MAATPTFPETIDVMIPGLPSVLEGFRILHLTDLHVRRPRKRHEDVLEAVGGCEHDLLAITGDSMVEAGDEGAAADFLARLIRVARPKVAALGVWGNHDTIDLRERLRHLPIRWLDNSAWSPPGLPMTVLGVDCIRKEHLRPRGDLSAALREAATHLDGGTRFRLLLAHIPTWLPAASAAEIDLVLSGHTHAGQCRLPTGHILYNATPGWPLRFSSGLLRKGRTRCLISRGLGEVYVPGLRFFCKPQMPLVVLRRGEVEAVPDQQITHVRRW